MREGVITKVTGDGLTGPNWVTWRVGMMSLFALCEVELYVRGELERPDKNLDPDGYDIWKKNDNYAHHLITQNVSDEALVHIQHGATSNIAWKNLESIYEDKSQETAVAIIRNLWHTTAEEEDDIGEHLTTLKKSWERLNLVDDDQFKIPEAQFKIAIISSLPPSWDTFTRPYITDQNRNNGDPKIHATSQELIGVIKEEYSRRLHRDGKSNKQDLIHQINYSKPKASLSSRITDPIICQKCGKHGHKTSDCKLLSQTKCAICECLGHETKDCYSRKAKELKRKREAKNDKNKKGKKKFKPKKKDEGNNEEQSHQNDEHVIFYTENDEISQITFDSSEEGQYFNFTDSNVSEIGEIDMRVIYYDWLADSATTSHVCNNHSTFTEFQPLTATTVTGIGNLSTTAQGRGTVELISQCGKTQYLIELKDVLYIPNNRNNLIALTKWDHGGQKFIGEHGRLSLLSKDGTLMVTGTKTDNNLYKMMVTVRKSPGKTPNGPTPYVFTSTHNTQSWEEWHNRFGHVSYGRLQHMHDKHLVTGLTVDNKSQKPDCIACTESKHTVQPFGKNTERNSKSGDLTHIDLWGKYAIASINGKQHYILFVDDCEKYSTVNFLKQKSEATQHVKEYITYLKTHDKNPKAIRIDRGR